MLEKIALNQILDANDCGIIIIDHNNCIQAWNKWLSKYTTFDKSTAKNKTLHEIFGDNISKHFNAAIEDALENGRSTFLSPRLHKHPLPLYRDVENKEIRKLIYQKISISSLTLESGERYCIINIIDMSASVNRENSLKAQASILKEVTENLRISEQKVRHVALHDPLTTLANRSLFNDRLEMAIEQARRHKEFMSIMMIDIDRFKQINDSYGHYVGDALLVEIGKRLQSCIRSSDTAARLGGDEFAVILTQLKKLDLDGISKLAKKINHLLSQPIIVDDLTINTGGSIGISVFSIDADNAIDLLKKADIAMYNVKKNGRSNWQFFSEKMHTEIDLHQKKQDSLKETLNNDRILVHYQPEINLKTGKITTLEALVRYMDKDGNLIMPNDFIPIAEEMNLINDITDSVLKHICDLCSSWGNSLNIEIAVNISSKQFIDADLINKLYDTHKFLKKTPIQTRN